MYFPTWKQFLFLLIVFLVFISGVCFAQKKEVLFYYEDFYPYLFFDEGEDRGPMKKLFQDKFADSNYQLKFASVSWNRAYFEASTHKNILIAPIAKTLKRDRIFKWLVPAFPTDTYIYTLASKDNITVNGLEDLYGYRIGGVLGDFRSKYLLEHNLVEQANLEDVDSNKFNLLKCLKGRIDLFYFTETDFWYQIEKLKLNPHLFKQLFKVDELSGNLFLATRKDSDPELISLIEELNEQFDTENIVNNDLVF